MLAAGASHGVYDALVVAHVVCAILGFGSLAISGVYGFTGRDPSGPESVEEARRYFSGRGRLELFVWPVPFLGLAALAVEPGGRGVGQLWDVLALVVWAVGAAVLALVVRPAESALRTVLAGPEPDRAVMGGAATRLGWGSVTTDVVFFVALVLMIFQPH